MGIKIHAYDSQLDALGVNMISVLYDSYSFDREDVGGITRYFAEVIRLLPMEQVRPVMTTCVSHNLYVQQAPFCVPSPRLSFRSFWPKISFLGKYRLYRFLSKWLAIFFPGCEEVNRRAFLKTAKGNDYDVVHMTGLGYDWKCVARRKPLVVTIHDLIPELVNHDVKYDHMKRELYAAATQIIAVSEHTRQDAIRHYGIAPEKITTVYHGVTQLPPPKAIEELEGVRYVLYVGKRGGYKNFDLFVGALSSVMLEDASMYLVCTGSDFTSTEKTRLRDLGIYERVFCRRFSDGELHWLFAHAQVFVYPSLYEGFGLPILDAFATGCPVLLARASCFPEVAGDAALYFNPQNESDLKCQLKRILDSGDEGESLRAKLIKRGYEQCSRFSWSRCARETVAVYQKALKEFVR